MVENLSDLGFSNNFSDTTPKIPSVKEKSNKLDIIKIKIFCSTEDTVEKMKS